jgi:hypothetical protein
MLKAHQILKVSAFGDLLVKGTLERSFQIAAFSDLLVMLKAHILKVKVLYKVPYTVTYSESPYGHWHTREILKCAHPWTNHKVLPQVHASPQGLLTSEVQSKAQDSGSNFLAEIPVPSMSLSSSSHPLGTAINRHFLAKPQYPVVPYKPPLSLSLSLSLSRSLSLSLSLSLCTCIRTHTHTHTGRLSSL